MAFILLNTNYSSSSEATANVNTIKDMLGGLNEFQEGKNSYTLHLNMAQAAMKIFQDRNLADLASLEQVSGHTSLVYVECGLTNNK